MPEIDFYPDLNQAITASTIEFGLLLDFDGDSLVSSLPTACSAVSVLIGPEGGLSQAEIHLARDAGCKPIKLGPRVLRTETAAITALAIVQSTLGDL